MGRLARSAGQLRCFETRKNSKKANRAAYWTSLRAVIQSLEELPFAGILVNGCWPPLSGSSNIHLAGRDPLITLKSRLSGRDLFDPQVVQIAATQAHGCRSRNISDIFRVQPKQRGGVAVRGHNVGAGDHGVHLLDIIQVSA